MFKILCLHGKMQTGEILSGRLGTLRRKLKKSAHLQFVDAPYIVPPTNPEDSSEYRTWFYREQEGTTRISPASIETALAMLEAEWRLNGPYDGIVAFSMGGCVAAVMAALPGRFPGCKFVVTAGSPDIDLSALLNSNVCQKSDLDGAIPASLSSFHFAGSKDTAVPVASSRRLAAKFTSNICTFVEHEQGHCFPSKAALVDQCVEFIDRCMQTSAVASDTKVICDSKVDNVVETAASSEFTRDPSPDDLIAQMEELEVLNAIYPDDLSVDLGGGSGEKSNVADFIPNGVRTGNEILYMKLNPLEDGDSQIPGKWRGQFALRIKRPYNYPSLAAPVIEIDLGKLSLHDISSALQNSLRETVLNAAAESIGEPSIMSCVQAANDWLCTHNSESVVIPASASAKAPVIKSIEPSRGDASEALVGEYDEDGNVDEAATSELIRTVSALAGQVMAQIHRSGLRADAINYCSAGNTLESKGIFEASASARGIWNYTVGLVGKPSAGKSTFYNVATRAALSRDGRLMAAVASHPFTTIEPNVGPGWWTTAIENKNINGSADKKGARYGRDPRGGRYLPLVVKDVAGLVPGAYQGRGKGNRFLGDLCDADVLVHVVDASGKSDRDGNALDEMSSSANPMEDAHWIREELHRWIYGNIRAKWSSVVRLGGDGAVQRLVQLFSGYQGPRACILSAIQYSSLDTAVISMWTAYDLHKLVALYLSIRFPTCLALNKIDAMDEKQRSLISSWQKEIEDLGEVAVPVCAAAESWNLLQAAREQGSTVGPSTADVAVAGKAAFNRVKEAFGDDGLCGVLTAISAAVSLRPPVLCFPVSDLTTEMPVGWHAGTVSSTEKSENELLDCLLMKPGSTVEDLYDALKRGALSHAHISGDFVRAEGRSLDSTGRKKQLGREILIDESNCVIKVQTNRKSVWQADAKAQERSEK